MSEHLSPESVVENEHDITSHQSKTQPTVVDLFAGGGGVTAGFKSVGFRALAAVEIDPIAAATYTLNHPEVDLFCRDIRGVNPQEILDECKISPGELTVLSVCAPCQPFSHHLSKFGDRDESDLRTQLVLEMVRFVDLMQPRYAIMENVPGLAKRSNKKILDKLIDELRHKLGYNVVAPTIIDAVNYGVPQFRRRLILLCSRENEGLSMPPETHAHPFVAEEEGKSKWRTVAQAFEGIHRLASGQQSRSDPLHKARRHTKINIERLRCIPKNGGSRSSLPEHLVLNCHRGHNGYNDVYGRMDSTRPANTLTTGCTNFTKGRFAHPTANRAITLREAARLQTFRDDYQFTGNYDEISRQIGNAVPVKLASVFANHLLNL